MTLVNISGACITYPTSLLPGIMRVCLHREPSPVWCRGWRYQWHGYIIASFFSYPSPTSLHVFLLLLSLHIRHLSPLFLAEFLSLYLYTPVHFCFFFALSLLHKAHGSVHRYFVSADFFPLTLCSLFLSFSK